MAGVGALWGGLQVQKCISSRERLGKCCGVGVYGEKEEEQG